jgi:hypothetical protein
MKDEMAYYDDSLSKDQIKFVNDLANIKNDPNSGLHQTALLFGLPIFWDLSLDGTSLGKDNAKICQNAVLKFMKMPYAKPFVLTFLLKSINNISDNNCVISSIDISTAILGQFNAEFCYGNSSAEDELLLPHLLGELNKELNLVEIVLKAVEAYHQHVKKCVKELQNNGKGLPENVGKHAFLSSYSHEQTLKTLLEFAAYIVIQGKSKEHTIGEAGIKLLWDIFVKNANFEIDQEIFLKWIYTDSSQTNDVFSDDEKKFFFFQIWCNPEYINYQTATALQVKCFHYFFVVVNNQLGHVSSNTRV